MYLLKAKGIYTSLYFLRAIKLVKAMSRKILIGVILIAVIVAAIVATFLLQKKEKVIVIGTTDPPVHLDPAKAYEFMSCEVIYNVFDTLVRLKPGTLQIEPGLAEKWEFKDNGAAIVFYLRKGVKFHDGTELTAHVVKYSIERALQLKGDPSWLISEFIEDVKVVDKYTVEFKLKEPFAPILSVFTFTVFAPVSPEAVKKLGNDTFDVKPVGTGPFKVVDFKKDQYVILERFEDYWDKSRLPKLKKIIIKIFKDSTTLRLALEKGEVDIAFRHLSVEDLQALKGKSSIIVEEKPSLQIRYLVFNIGNFTMFKDVKVRQAIAYAIDRDAIVKKVFKEAASKIYSLVNPNFDWCYKPVFEKYDLERSEALAEAVKLLREAGYSENKPLKFTLWYTTDHYGPKEADVAQCIKEALEETGLIKVDLRGLTWSEFINKLESYEMECFLLGWYPDYVDPDNYLYPFLYSSTSGPVFSCWYSNPEVDQTLVKARQTADLEERAYYYSIVQEYLAKDVPYIPLWSQNQNIAYRNNIKGVSLEPSMILWFWPLDKS